MTNIGIINIINKISKGFNYNKMGSEIVIGIGIVLISIIIYIVKNKDICTENINKIKNKRVVKIISNISLIIVVIIFMICVYNLLKKINTNIEFCKTASRNDVLFEEFDERAEKELYFYEEAIKKDYGNVEKEPYIPEGFKYLEGDVKSGYVIADSDNNQYVWVPCTNKDDENIVKLGKYDFSLESAIKNYNCVDLEYEDFIESALKYGGFYISRFEIGKENEKIVSKPNVKVLTNISRTQVIEKLDNMYDNINCKLINGYAYDTTLTWVKKSNEFEIDKVNIETQEVLTGRNQCNNIYDFTDNIMELSLEDFYDTIIYRGFDYGNILEDESRYNTLDQDICYKDIYNIKTMNIIAFRSVIYK